MASEVSIWGTDVGTAWGFSIPMEAPLMLSVRDGVIVDNSPGILLSVTEGIIIEHDPGVDAEITPWFNYYSYVKLGEESLPQEITITNIGTQPFTIVSVTKKPEMVYQGTTPVGKVVLPGQSIKFSLKFVPSIIGNFSDTVVINIGDGLTLEFLATAIAVPAETLKPLRTLGNQIVQVEDTTKVVVLKSANWFGAEGTNFTPHGTWKRNWKGILEQIKGLGFNCIRLPFSGDMPGKTPPETAIDFELNPEFVGKTSMQIFELIIAYCGELGLYVVLDHHRRKAGDGADGSPIASDYTKEQWITTWQTMATQFASFPAVIGADVHNEPHLLSWNDWATLAEECGNAIHTIAPNWMIMVEGVGSNSDGSSYWWGGAMKDVATRPITLTTPNRVVYSPHEYGQSVQGQSWLAYEGQPPPANWPLNLYDVWNEQWGFIFYNNIGPIWVGEFGGYFGLDGNGAYTKPNRVEETAWLDNLMKYWLGDSNGDGASNLPAGKKGMSFAYWSFNPNSVDTGGLLQDDWLTIQQPKITLLQPILSQE